MAEPELEKYIRRINAVWPSCEWPKYIWPAGVEKTPDWDAKLEAYMRR